jgi:hypothetical protein
MNDDSIPASLEIRPEPTDEEVAVIVTALAAINSTASSTPIENVSNHAKPSAWTLVGRRSAHHASPHARKQWSRDFAWLERTER